MIDLDQLNYWFGSVNIGVDWLISVRIGYSWERLVNIGLDGINSKRYWLKLIKIV